MARKAKPPVFQKGKVLYAIAWEEWNSAGQTRADIAYLHANDAPTARTNFYLCNRKRAKRLYAGKARIVAIAPVLGYRCRPEDLEKHESDIKVLIA